MSRFKDVMEGWGYLGAFIGIVILIMSNSAKAEVYNAATSTPIYTLFVSREMMTGEKTMFLSLHWSKKDCDDRKTHLHSLFEGDYKLLCIPATRLHKCTRGKGRVCSAEHIKIF